MPEKVRKAFKYLTLGLFKHKLGTKLIMDTTTKFKQFLKPRVFEYINNNNTDRNSHDWIFMILQHRFYPLYNQSMPGH